MFELNQETRYILGRPNFFCGPIADRLRELGHDINRKAEDEQAAVIYFMLDLYEKHGDSWRIHASKLLADVDPNNP